MSASCPIDGAGESLRAPVEIDVQERLRLAEVERERAVAEANRERRRRRRAHIVLLVAFALVLVIAGLSAWRYVHIRKNQSQEIVRRAAAERELDQALVEIRHRMTTTTAGRDPAGDAANLELAFPLLDRAETLVRDPNTSDELKTDVAVIRKELEYALSELQALAAIDRIRLDNIDAHERRISAASIALRYEEALAAIGIDASAQHAMTTSAVLKTHPHRERLLAALSDWRIVEPDEKRKFAVGYLLRIVEAREMYRSQLRDALVRRDDVLVHRLLKSPALAKQPAIYLARLSVVLLSVNRENQAIDVLKQGLHRHPGDFWLNVELGGVWLQRKPNGPAAAREFFKAAVAIRPRCARANYLLGVTAQRLGDLPEAAAAFERAIESDANFVDAYLHLCAVLRDRDDFDGAIQYGRQAISLAPASPAPPSCLATVLIKQGKCVEAIDLYRQSLAVNVRYLPALLGLGELLREEDALDEAEALLKRAVDDAPDQFAVLNQYGLILQAKGDFANAAEQFRKAMGLAPNDPAACVFLGCARMAQGKRAEALRWFQAGIERDPKYAPAYVQIGLDHLARAEFGDAVARLQLAVDVDPRSAAAQLHLGRALDLSGEKERALKAYRRAAELQPRCVATQFFRGRLAFELNESEEAIEALERAAKNCSIGNPLCGLVHIFLQRARQ